MRIENARWSGVLGLVGAALFVIAPLAQANTPTSRMRLGRIWYASDYDGASAWSSKLHYPPAITTGGGGSGIYIQTKQWASQARKDGTHFFCTNWTDESTGTLFDYVCSYMFRTMNYGYPTLFPRSGDPSDFRYVFPIETWRYQRWAEPEVWVSGSRVALNYPEEPLPYVGFPDSPGQGARPPIDHGQGLSIPYQDPYRPYPANESGSNLVSEKVIHEMFRYIPGVRVDRRIYGFAYGTPHQDYVINDMLFTNDGQVGNEYRDPSNVWEHTQTITNMIWEHCFDYQNMAAQGGANSSRQNAQDAEAVYVNGLPGVGHAHAMAWDIDDDGTPGADYGDVASNPVYENVMLGNAFILMGPLFVSTGPGADFDVDLGDQPLTRNILFERGFDLAGKGYSPSTMQEQMLYATGGTWHLDMDQSFRDNPATSAIKDDFRGPTLSTVYGPQNGDITQDNFDKHGWTLANGESVRIIEVVAAGGIDIEESRRIGEAWNAARDAGDPESSWMSAGDVSLYMTGKDTALKALNMAYWNYFGEFAPGVTGANLATWGVSDMVSPKPAAYNQSYNVPDPPQPPSYISVRTLAGEDLPQPDGTTSPSYGIEVRFTLESETNAGDHDTGVSDFLGYRVMRKAGSRNAPWEIVADGPASDFASAPSTTAPDVLGVDYTLPAGRIFIDGGTILGRDYWYSVVAYDDGSQNWARPGQALESSRWWTYSGFTNVGVVGNSAASTVLDEIVVVPNPWISSGQTFGSPGNIAGYERIRFGNVPDPCTIKILTTAGNLVTTLEHSGSGDYLWDGRNADNQYVVSDVYIYVVEHETLGRKIGKFIVIR